MIQNHYQRKLLSNLQKICVSCQVKLDHALIHKLNGFITVKMVFANNLDILVVVAMETVLKHEMTAFIPVEMYKMCALFPELLGLAMGILDSGIMIKQHSRAKPSIMVDAKEIITGLILKKNVGNNVLRQRKLNNHQHQYMKIYAISLLTRVLVLINKFLCGFMTQLQVLASNLCMEAVKEMRIDLYLKNNVRDSVEHLKDKMSVVELMKLDNVTIMFKSTISMLQAGAALNFLIQDVVEIQTDFQLSMNVNFFVSTTRNPLYQQMNLLLQ